MTSKKDMFNRLAQVSKNAPLQETTVNKDEVKEQVKENRRKSKVSKKPKNLLIPEDLWDAYEDLKDKNITSLLMTPYILEAFREKLTRDGAFESKK